MLRKFTPERVLTYTAFTLSFGIYLLTLERSVSFWDCGEFITSAAGLQVGHPPGAPLYAMVARLFAALAPTSQHIALMVNSFSALASALTIAFLFKTIVLFFDITAKGEVKSRKVLLVAAFAAAMLFAFTDTFWFSAVEAEVYAFSSLLTAVCFWAGLKWYTTENGNVYSRWIVLIAYLCGLSYGVHLLNLLIIPAIAYLVIAKRYQLNLFKQVLAIVVSSSVVGLLMYGFVPLILWCISRFELLFVNNLGLPFNSGSLFATGLIALLLMGTVALGYHFRQRQIYFVTLCLSLFSLGFSSYAMIIIRGTQNPPMNQNQVDNIFSLKAYLDRDQYGKSPLLYGPYYSAPIKSIEMDQPIYLKVGKRYVARGYTIKNKHYNSLCTIFPRMYSTDPLHVEGYQSWGGIPADTIIYKTERKNNLRAARPTFTQNLTYFAGYQLWWMYFRYLLWNYSGRQNDLLGNGNILAGNFITGISPLDNLMLGPQDELPAPYNNDKTSNRYFLIPLILGLVGLYYQWMQSRDIFLTTLLFFFFTGIAIVLFLNQTPYQARERDYAYVGSFYAFAIWIGYGFLYLAKMVERIPNRNLRSSLVASFLALPVLVLSQNYDDHDRSGRSIARNYALNFLNSVPANSLLVSYGDNDTFPLWYLQMVERVRTDVKVFNYNYLFTNWNPGQLTRKTYENDAFKLKDPLFYKLPSKLKNALEIDTTLSYIDLDSAIMQIITENRRKSTVFDKKPHRIPQDIIVLPGLSKKDSANITLAHKVRITKDQILVLDVIANNYPQRTVSFTQTTPERAYKLLKQHVSRVGLNNELKIRPHLLDSEVDRKKTLESYSFLMNQFVFDSLSTNILLDDTSIRILNSYRAAFMSTAAALATYGDTAKAIRLISRCNQNIPMDFIPLGSKQLAMVKLLFNLNMGKEGLMLANQLKEEHLQMLKFQTHLNSFQRRYVVAEKELALHSLTMISEILKESSHNIEAQEILAKLKKYEGSADVL